MLPGGCEVQAEQRSDPLAHPVRFKPLLCSPAIAVGPAYVYLANVHTYDGADMPKTKLTLSVESAVVERAKRFSRRNQTTVSDLVQEFLSSLEDSEQGATPVVSRLRGVLPPSASRDEYREHLEAKHR